MPATVQNPESQCLVSRGFPYSGETGKQKNPQKPFLETETLTHSAQNSL